MPSSAAVGAMPTPNGTGLPLSKCGGPRDGRVIVGATGKLVNVTEY